MFKLLTTVTALLLTGLTRTSEPVTPTFADETTAYAIPTLTQSPNGDVVLSWTEKDPQGTVRFYVARSTDQGQTFSEKRLIHAATGIGSSRLMRPRVLFKKDGTMVAVFSNRVEESATASAAPAAPASEHAGHGADHKPAASSAPARPRNQQIVFATSKDNGQTWTAPRPVHPDQTSLVRGFFDATVLANGEVAVAYLRDIEGQAHSRDLRMVVSKGGQFGEEKVLEPFVCDCCNVSLLVDASGALHVYYRENRDNTRDIDHLVSTNHGATFAPPTPLYADNWKINGCPHSGPSSTRFGKSTLVAWNSGTQTNDPGVRVVTGEGKRLFVLNEPTAKNGFLLPVSGTSAVLLWEQVNGGGEVPVTSVGLRTIAPNAVSETRWVDGSENATNATGLALGDRVLVAYEVKRPSKLNALKVSTVKL
jgi:hypothetical protein